MDLEFLDWYLFGTGAVNLLPGIAALGLFLAYPTWLAFVGRWSQRMVLPSLLAIVPALMLVPDFFGYLPTGRGNGVVDWGQVAVTREIPLVILALSTVLATAYASRRIRRDARGFTLSTVLGATAIAGLGLALAAWPAVFMLGATT